MTNWISCIYIWMQNRRDLFVIIRNEPFKPALSGYAGVSREKWMVSIYLPIRTGITCCWEEDVIFQLCNWFSQSKNITEVRTMLWEWVTHFLWYSNGPMRSRLWTERLYERAMISPAHFCDFCDYRRRSAAQAGSNARGVGKFKKQRPFQDLVVM